MNRFVSIILRLLSLAVIVINLIYIESAGVPSLSSYIAFVKPYFIFIIALVIIFSLLLLVVAPSATRVQVSVLILIGLALFPLYHPYLKAFYRWFQL